MYEFVSSSWRLAVLFLSIIPYQFSGSEVWVPCAMQFHSSQPRCAPDICDRLAQRVSWEKILIEGWDLPEIQKNERNGRQVAVCSRYMRRLSVIVPACSTAIDHRHLLDHTNTTYLSPITRWTDTEYGRRRARSLGRQGREVNQKSDEKCAG